MWVWGAPKAWVLPSICWKAPPLLQCAWPSLLTAFLKGQKPSLGQISGSLKARVLGEWNDILYPSLNAVGYNVFSVYQSSSSTCIFSPWGRRRSNDNICKQNWKVIRKDWVLAGKMPAPSQLRVEHSPGLEETLAQPFACWSPRTQVLYHWKQVSKLVMETFVLSHPVLSWRTTFMRAYLYAKGVCNDSLSSGTAQSSEQDGIRAHFSACKPKTKEQPQVTVSKKKALTAWGTQLSPLAASQLHIGFGMDSHIKPSEIVEEGHNQIHYL